MMTMTMTTSTHCVGFSESVVCLRLLLQQCSGVELATAEPNVWRHVRQLQHVQFGDLVKVNYHLSAINVSHFGPSDSTLLPKLK